MKAVVFFTLLLTLSAGSPVSAKEYPHKIAGLELGGNIENQKDLIRMDTVIPLRFSPFIKEVETAKIPGFDYGLLWIGNCAEPGRIVRIKMKYMDPSKDFYEKLLERINKRFGKPDEWRGDPFHIVLAWKWAFVDEKGNDISMILEHNTRDEAETRGNTIKLTMWNLVEKEKACYNEKNPKETRTEISNQPSWDLLIPQ